MRILLVRPNPYEEAELKEFLQNYDCEVHTVSGQKAICQALSEMQIDKVFYNVISVDDFTIIKYINVHYPLIKIVAMSEEGFNSAIENVRSGEFESIQRPFHLVELKEVLHLNDKDKVNEIKKS